MSDYGFVHDGRVFTPNQSVGVTPADNDSRNKQIERAELAHWATKPERFATAYFSFPAEDMPLFGRQRPYRTSFFPCLHTYVNQETAADAGTAKHAHVSTWLGTKLGTITSARVYTHNFGGRFVAITVKGTNGAMYYGRASWDNGNIIRLRRAGGR